MADSKTGANDEIVRKRAILGLLGLARRAGALRLGAGPVLRALKTEERGVVFLASDAGADLVRRIDRAVVGGELPSRLFRGEELAESFGRERLAVVSVHDRDFVAGLEKYLLD